MHHDGSVRADSLGVLRWPRLAPGDRVRLVSPASFPSEEGVRDLRGVLEGWGLGVEVADHALDRWGFMAGRDSDRLHDLNEAFRDPGVRAVVATGGGAGAYRIAHAVDIDAVRADPKPVVGFSDITCLHLALWRGCRLASVHGCLDGELAVRTARAILFGSEAVVLAQDPTSYTAQVLVPGRATGPLVGGNLSAMAHAAGAGLPSFDGSIMLLEDKRDIGLGRVDRQLTQLRDAGALDGVAGIALGLFTGFEGYQDRGWTLVDVLNDQLGSLGVPVLGGLVVGHNGTDHLGRPDQSCAPLGPSATLDTTARTLTCGAAAV